MKKLKKLPSFQDVSQEKIFWENHDSVDYIDWSQAKPAAFPELKASTKIISLRLPEGLFNEN